jgi:glycyl-tRNA synthetase beta chain
LVVSHLLQDHHFRIPDGSGYGMGELSTGSFVEFVVLVSGGGFGAGIDNPSVITDHSKAIADQVLDFFADRLKVQQREAGVRHDLIDAVFALGGEDDLVRLLARVKALQAFVGTEDGVNLLAGYKRAANILKSSPERGGGPPLGGGGAGLGSAHSLTVPSTSTDPSTASGPPPRSGEDLAELALRTALDTAEPLAAAAIEAEDFASAMTALASLRAPIDAFFEGVMVNDPDPDKRAYRLGLLTRFRDAVHRVADFSKIEG